MAGFLGRPQLFKDNVESTRRILTWTIIEGGAIMRHARRPELELAVSIAVLAVSGVNSRAQANYPPPNDLPNPYRTILNWTQLPDGRKWGSTAGVSAILRISLRTLCCTFRISPLRTRRAQR
jgi:hypothetical protein